MRRAGWKWGWTLPEERELARLLERGVQEGVAPALVLLLRRRGRTLLELAAGRARAETVFDLASLTKPLATAPLALDLRAREILPWSLTLGEIWGPATPADKAEISIYQLLTHSAGFAPHRPFFTLLDKQPSHLRRGLLKAMLMNEPLEYQPGTRALYSDLGYLLLGLILEEAGGDDLDGQLAGLHSRLGVEGPRYLPLGQEPPWPREEIAPCGSLPGRPRIQGHVEDENAYSLGGVAGQAGLFGNARQVAAMMEALVAAEQGEVPWPPGLAGKLWQVDRDTPGSGRTPGFDTPSGARSAAGSQPPPGTVGHLGFTGVSLWWQPGDNAGVVLLSNRVALGRDNQKIRDFRRQVHDLAWPVLGY